MIKNGNIIMDDNDVTRMYMLKHYPNKILDSDKLNEKVVQVLYHIRNTHKKGRKYMWLQAPEGKFDNHVWLPSIFEKLNCCNSCETKSRGGFGTNTKIRLHCRTVSHIRNLILKHGVYEIVTHFKIMHKFSKVNQELILKCKY